MMAGANLRFRAVNDGKSPNFWQRIFQDFPRFSMDLHSQGLDVDIFWI